MTRLVQFISLAFTALGFAMPAAALEASDLEGPWYGSGMIVSAGEPILWDLILLIDADGVPSGISNRYRQDGTWEIEDISAGSESLVLNIGTGQIHGSFVVGAGTPVDLTGFQMNSGADLFSGANATEDAVAAPSILTFVKRGSNYQDANLEGTWWLYGFYEDFGAGSESAGSILGTLAVDSDAIIESGSLIYAGQPTPVEIPAGTILDLGGSGNIRVEFQAAETNLSGALDDTTTTVGVDSTSGFSVGDYVGVGEEFMKIDAIPVGSASFTVVRGQLGTVATAHADDASVSKANPLGGDLYWRLAAGKTLMIGNSIGWKPDGRNRHQFFQWVKSDPGVLPVGLAGGWSVALFEDASDASEASAAKGELVIDETGSAVTGGSLVFNDATSVTVSGGGIDTTATASVFEIPNLGYEGTADESRVDLALSPDEGVFFGVSSTTGDLSGLLVGVPEPAARLLGVASLFVIAALRRRSRPRG